MLPVVDWLQSHSELVAPLVMGAVAVWLMMPRLPERKSLRRAGLALGAVSLIVGGWTLMEPSGETSHGVLVALFGGIAIASAAMTVTSRYPVYAALWFALATLSVCGLFLLQSAPFLAAATVIVYAGAIVVTFLFVIMLAQQGGSAQYDGQAAWPLPAVIVTFALLGGTLYSLHDWRAGSTADGGAASRFVSAPAAFETNSLSRPAAGETEIGTMRGIGRSLFGDYLFAVEIAGSLLLVAAIGAIAIAPRRAQGTL